MKDGVACYRNTQQSRKDHTITRRNGKWWLDYNHGGSPYHSVSSSAPVPPRDGWGSVDCQTRSGGVGNIAVTPFGEGAPAQQGCGASCSESHDGLECLVCGGGWGGHSGHSCNVSGFKGKRGSFPAKGGGGGPIKVGDSVRVKPGVKPSRGWGQAEGATGTVRSISGSDCTIDFPRQKGWAGVLSEMEKV
jgi:hypothetical protein